MCLKCGLRVPNSHQLLIWRVYIRPPNHGKFPLCAGQEGESHISKGSPGVLKMTKVARNKYSHKNVLLNKFRIWYLVRNLILGTIFNLRFLFPYISAYLCIMEVILNFAFIIGLYFDLKKKYIEPLVGQFVFKTLALPVVLYEIYQVIVLMVGVL